MVPPFDHEWIIAGQGTAGLEILEQCPDVAAIAVPVGGGGLLAGVAAAVKQLRPDVTIVGVEPSGAAAMKASIAAGHAVTLPSTASVADGLMPVRPGDQALAHVQAFVDAVVTVDDPEIIDAVLWIFANAKIVAEPSGAVTTAAVLTGAAGRRDQRGRTDRRHRERRQHVAGHAAPAGTPESPLTLNRDQGSGIRDPEDLSTSFDAF